MKKFILFISLIGVQVALGECVDCWEDDTGNGCCDNNKGKYDETKITCADYECLA